jgi:rare lipoprotein A
MHHRLVLVALCAFATMGFMPVEGPMDGKDQTVTASFYQSGEVTANGETFDPQGHTAAHRKFPFGTLLKVRNSANGRSVIVRVNDRGPYVDGRSIDLSLGAAQAIDMVEDGLAQVEITKLN